MKPFELIHIKSFCDETAMYEAVFTNPMTLQQLIDLALADRNRWGYIQLHGFNKFYYNAGKVRLDELTPEEKQKPIRKMTVHNCWRRIDYIVKL